MPRYEITSPDGTRYEINAPDGATEADAIAYAQKQFGSQSQAKPKRGAATGLGLGVRNMLQSALAIPAAAVNAGYGAYNLGADAIRGKRKGHRFQDYNQTVADALTKWGFPEPENPREEFAGKIVQGATGGLTGVGAATQLARSASPMALRAASVLGANHPVANTAAGAAVPVGVQMAQDQGLGAGSQLAAGIAAAAATHSGPSAAAAGGRAATRATRNALASRLAQPLGPEEAALVLRSEQMGLPLRPGQYSPSNIVRQGDSVIADSPWPRVAGFRSGDQTRVLPSEQTDQFVRLISREFGEDAPRITGEVIQRAARRISDGYDEILPRNTVRMDPQLEQAMAAAENLIATNADALDDALTVRLVRTMNSIRSQVTGDGLPGSIYQAFRARGGKLDELAASGSPTLAKVAGDVRDAIDDAFARQARGSDAEAMATLRRQTRALRAVEPLANKAPTGAIAPGQLMGAVAKEYGNPTEAGNLGTLAQVGSAFLKAMPNSGTSERSAWREFLRNPITATPRAAGHLANAPLSLIGGRATNRLINSPEVRARLLAEALRNAPP